MAKQQVPQNQVELQAKNQGIESFLNIISNK